MAVPDDLEGRYESGESAAVAAALAFAVVGGLVLLAAQLMSLPSVVLVGGVGCATVGLVVAFVLAWRSARRAGRSVVRALGEGLLTLVHWLGALV